MEDSCRDIPMRLDIKHQPLDFDIYLSQVIDIPRTSIEEPPYNFRLELEALERVDQIIERSRLFENRHQKDSTNNQESILDRQTNSNGAISLIPSNSSTPRDEECNSQQTQPESSTSSSLSTNAAGPSNNVASASAFSYNESAIIPPPSCPIETPLTPIKCSVETNNSANNNKSATSIDSISTNQSPNKPQVNKIDPSDFEDIHYNPFDHLELQTIDELRELDLVFQASYANQAKNNN